MKIDTELSDDERDVLLMMLGAATGCLYGVCQTGTMLKIVNKLYRHSPNFIPYETSPKGKV